MPTPKFTQNHLLRALMVATIAVIVIGVFRGQSSLTHYWQLKDSQSVLQKTVDELKHENAKLSEEIIKLKESPGYAKKTLKDKYHITEPDEDIVYFADEE